MPFSPPAYSALPVSEQEEQLPTMSSSSSSSPLPPRPDHDCSPAEIQTYFAAILRDIHHVSDDEAWKIASNWRIGRGYELKYYDIETFRGMFGPEAGNLLYGYAHDEVEWPPKAPKSMRRRRVQAGSSDEVPTDFFGLPRGEAILRLLFGLICTSGGAGLIILLARGGNFAMPALLISLGSAVVFIISYWLYYYCPSI